MRGIGQSRQKGPQDGPQKLGSDTIRQFRGSQRYMFVGFSHGITPIANGIIPKLKNSHGRCASRDEDKLPILHRIKITIGDELGPLIVNRLWHNTSIAVWHP